MILHVQQSCYLAKRGGGSADRQLRSTVGCPETEQSKRTNMELWVVMHVLLKFKL